MSLAELKSGINIARALATDGWMSEAELFWLATQAQQHRRIVELGSFLGRSTRALAEHTPGIVYALDDWNGPRGARLCGHETVALNDGQRAGLYDGFCENVGDLIAAGKIIPMRGDHALFSKVAFLSGAPDMIFIDGDHEYTAVRRDIVNAKRKLMPGGLLCGHDASWAGVCSAVTELTGEFLTVPNTDIWFAL